MNSELLKGTLNIIILLLLKNKTSYGYEISSEIRTLSNNKLIITDSSLYTVLLRLEHLNYIHHYWLKDNMHPRRKYYNITQNGLDYLEENFKNYNIINLLITDLLERSFYE